LSSTLVCKWLNSVITLGMSFKMLVGLLMHDRKRDFDMACDFLDVIEFDLYVPYWKLMEKLMNLFSF